MENKKNEMYLTMIIIYQDLEEDKFKALLYLPRLQLQYPGVVLSFF